MLIRLLTLTALLLFYSSCKNETAIMDDQSSIQIEHSSSFKNYKKVSTEKSGLKFNNKITHNLNTKFNLFDYDFFYNGAGVGIEDINNDGLKDIIFKQRQFAI
jgi:hypothetical protein